MNFRDILATANANLFRSKLRTWLTIVAVFIGAFTLTLTNGLGGGITTYINKQIDDLGQNSTLTITVKNSTSFGNSTTPTKYQPGRLSTSKGETRGRSNGLLDQSDVTLLRADTDLTDVEPVYTITPDFIEGNNSQKYQIGMSNVTNTAHLDLASGSQLDNNSPAYQLELPVNYVSVLGYGSNDNTVGKTVTIALTDATGLQHLVPAQVVGIQQSGIVSASGAVFNQALTNNLYAVQSIGLPPATADRYAFVTAQIVGSLSAIHVNAVKSRLGNMGYSGETTKDELGSISTAIGVVSGVLDAFAIITLLAASFGIVNTLLMSVKERTKEIGLMKAMGMRSNRIFLLFSLEAALIGFWGSALGVGVANVLGRGVNNALAKHALKNLPGFNLLSFPLKSMITIIVVIMLVAFLAGTLPARSASKQNPIDSLRYE